MNKPELIKVVSERANLTQKDVGAMLNALTETITDSLKIGERVQLAGFGTFETVHKEKRECRSPYNGEMITVPARDIPKFKPSNVMKDLFK